MSAFCKAAITKGACEGVLPYDFTQSEYLHICLAVCLLLFLLWLLNQTLAIKTNEAALLANAQQLCFETVP